MPHDPTAPTPDRSDRPTVSADDELRLESEPLKQEGDALRDGSGSRHGQSPPNVEPRENR